MNEIERICQHPVRNAFARAARPLPCGRPGPIAGAFVHIGASGELEVIPLPMCTRHACESATTKLIYSIARQPLTDGEVDFLRRAGYADPELIAAGLLGEPAEGETTC